MENLSKVFIWPFALGPMFSISFYLHSIYQRIFGNSEDAVMALEDAKMCALIAVPCGLIVLVQFVSELMDEIRKR